MPGDSTLIREDPLSDAYAMAKQDNRPLRLLSLDGGGVKGITSLRILQAIFKKLSEEVGRNVKPCEYFDLIGGTSTGGLIAVLLGVLHYSVDEAIQVYNIQAKKIFKPKRWSHLRSFKYLGPELKHYWFEGKNLENAVVETLKWKQKGRDMSLLQPKNAKCKTFVCAFNGFTTQTDLLRSYPTNRTGHTSYDCSVVEAVRATSAAPLFFEPIEIQHLNEGTHTVFLDGGLRANNPISEVLIEAQRIWPDRSIECLLSVGTGVALPQGFKPDKNRLHQVLEKLAKIATDADDKARQFHETQEGRSLKSTGKYFRFSVPQGISKDDMEKFERMPYMEAMTGSYIRDQAFEIEKCAKQLAKPDSLLNGINKSRSSSSIPSIDSLQLGQQITSRDGGERDSRGANVSSTASQLPFEQYMQRGNSHLQSAIAAGLPSIDVHQHFEKALAEFTQALEAFRTQSNGIAEERLQVYKKLMDTEERLSYSHLIPLQATLAHVAKAQNWGACAKEAAQQTGNQSMFAQTEFLAVCLKAREIELEAKKDTASKFLLLNHSDMVLQELLEKMQNIRSSPPSNHERLQEFERLARFWSDRIKGLQSSVSKDLSHSR
ncbi:MAG: hypothetical protein M1821_003964 [Bathelium mastoideum]|nr:MAG: hypothetical protein M1821_003964 [Bathelium mastoideum]KAI9691038.1 MAG: hypothetical protein M1822_008658 [Bathelium mastoideum]